MKLPGSEKQWLKEIEKLIDSSYKKIEKSDLSNKEQFKSILDYVISCVSKNRRIARVKVAEKTEGVIDALAEYLKQTPEDQRSWAGTITFLYIKFHRVLGLIDEQTLLSVLHTSILPDSMTQ